MRTVIVLSGGESRGDFQVGALRYLHDNRIYPQVISATSVGSINGAKLAEGRRLPVRRDRMPRL
jgi:NTE family protein